MGKITAHQIKDSFKDRAETPGLLSPDAYAKLAQTLLDQGAGRGKTESVAAYRLRPLRLVCTSGADIQEQSVGIEPLYIVFDLKHWPNSYARSLVLQDIMNAYVRRMMEEDDINRPDFNGPGIWTTKAKSFESDYARRPQTDESAARPDLYDPDPAAFRLCLPCDKAMILPTTWGSYPMKPGGTLAIRESDVPALKAALDDIAAGRKTATEALFVKSGKSGALRARFDIYGMEPGFVDANYQPVPLRLETCTLLGRPSPAAPSNPASAGPSTPKSPRPVR